METEGLGSGEVHETALHGYMWLSPQWARGGGLAAERARAGGRLRDRAPWLRALTQVTENRRSRGLEPAAPENEIRFHFQAVRKLSFLARNTHR